MRRIMILAIALTASGVAMSRVADHMSATGPTLAKAEITPVRAASAAPTTAGVRSHAVARDQRGHFQTEGRIDGQRIAFMIDTGASVVALNETTAARFGLRPRADDYTARVSTANGTVKAARTRLSRVEVGELIGRDVDAVILPDTALSENLLGLSFLSQMKRYEFAQGKMLLEQ